MSFEWSFNDLFLANCSRSLFILLAYKYIIMLLILQLSLVILFTSNFGCANTYASFLLDMLIEFKVRMASHSNWLLCFQLLVGVDYCSINMRLGGCSLLCRIYKSGFTICYALELFVQQQRKNLPIFYSLDLISVLGWIKQHFPSVNHKILKVIFIHSLATRCHLRLLWWISIEEYMLGSKNGFFMLSVGVAKWVGRADRIEGQNG